MNEIIEYEWYERNNRINDMNEIIEYEWYKRNNQRKECTVFVYPVILESLYKLDNMRVG